MTRATILVPTHNHASTLALAVESALDQTMPDIEVIIIGDGVTDEVRQVVTALTSRDDRVVFMDRPKSPNHGEPYRHEAILAAQSDAIFYLCDDDLFLPEHVADLLTLLEDHNFVQSFNGYFDVSGDFYPFVGDLAEPRDVARLLQPDWENYVSLTGTAHSKAFYQAVSDPWTAPPNELPPDLFQWRKMVRHPKFCGATSARVTTVQLPTSIGRQRWTPAQRNEELMRWADVTRAADGRQRIDDLVGAAVIRHLWGQTRNAGELRTLLHREWERPMRRLVRVIRHLVGGIRQRP